MKRIAFSLIGGKAWTGGYNYQLNLFSALSEYEAKRVQVFIFLGTDIDMEILNRFKEIIGVTIIQSQHFNKSNQVARLVQSILLGIDQSALNVFKSYQIDVVFEVANFYGWRFPIPSIAWFTDLQHRKMPEYFSRFSYWKRELGFRAQVLSNRKIMVSSDDTLADFDNFYNIPKENKYVVKFAVPGSSSSEDLRSILALYHLPNNFYFMPNQFWKHKNHECVIKALKICKDRGYHFTIAVTGKQINTAKDSYFPYIKALVESNGLSDNFRLLGLIPYTHIQTLMLASNALINPSKFEGWSTTVEEAKSCGVEMILSNIRVHIEQTNNQAFFFNPESPDELADILCNFKVKDEEEKANRQTSSINGSIKRVENFAHQFADMVIDISNQVKDKSNFK